MNVTTWVIVGIVVLLVLVFVVAKFITSCLPKIIVLVVVLALAFLAYWYFLR